MTMFKTRQITFLVFLILGITFSSSSIVRVSGQADPPNDNRGIDMMLVVDNSCSMFSDDVARQSGKCAEGDGNDVDLLRIIGSEIFFDSLGIGDPLLEDRHQLGVISFGGDSQLVHGLAPIHNMRNALTAKVQNPDPQPWTDIGLALSNAYSELDRAGLPNNTPAIVLITDGKPETSSGQRYDLTIIQTMLEQHPDVPVFVMLVQNNENLSEEYTEYISFWQQADNQNSQIFHYVIEDQQQIDDTYQDVWNEIMGEPTHPSITLNPNEPQRFFVNQFAQALQITVIHDSSDVRGNIVITDPNENTVPLESGNGVRINEDDGTGRVDVIYIGEQYLTSELKGDYWTIESDVFVDVIIIPAGAYRINFIEPDVSFTNVRNVYDSVSPHPVSKPMTIQFNLLMKGDDSVVDERQDIDGVIINPDGSETNFPISTRLEPENGVYTLSYQFPVTSDNERAFYQIILHAGTADEQATQRIPIAKANLSVEVGRFPSLGAVSPAILSCTGGTSEVSITIDDYEYADPRTVQVYVEDIPLEQDDSNPAVYKGDVSALCAPLFANLQCSTSDNAVMTAKLIAHTQDGVSAPPSPKDIQVQTLAPTCTPTNTPTPSPTPTPTPTPVPPPPPPDQDNDGGIDSVDSCKTIPGVSWLKYCPEWMLVPIVLVLIGIIIALWKFIIPWIWVHIPSGRPPDGYIRICNKKDKRPRDFGMYTKGMQNRSSKITIGGDKKKAHIYVKGLQSPIEFEIERNGEEVVILNVINNKKRVFKERTADQITSKSGDITIYLALDPQKLKNC